MLRRTRVASAGHLRSPGAGWPPASARPTRHSYARIKVITAQLRKHTTAAILAGGQARRLGGVDKSALQVGDRSILERQLTLLRDLTGHVVIIANDPARFKPTGVRVVPDRIAGVGPIGAIYTALVEAPTAQVLVVACDMPFLTEPFITRLLDAGAGADVAVPRDARGRHPLCASYQRRIAPHLKARIGAGQLRVVDALDGLDVHEIGPEALAAFDHDGRLLLNVNSSDDYARAQF